MSSASASASAIDARRSSVRELPTRTIAAACARSETGSAPPSTAGEGVTMSRLPITPGAAGDWSAARSHASSRSSAASPVPSSSPAAAPAAALASTAAAATAATAPGVADWRGSRTGGGMG